MGHLVYVHRSYEDRLGPAIEHKAWLPGEFCYEVVKYNRQTEAVSFIHCPGFDVEPEPSVQSIVVIHSDGTVRRPSVTRDPYIYHHKWLFVSDDYRGFNVEVSKRRSLDWLSLADVDRSRIGHKSYWESHVIPQLGGK